MLYAKFLLDLQKENWLLLLKRVITVSPEWPLTSSLPGWLHGLLGCWLPGFCLLGRPRGVVLI